MVSTFRFCLGQLLFCGAKREKKKAVASKLDRKSYLAPDQSSVCSFIPSQGSIQASQALALCWYLVQKRFLMSRKILI